MPIYLIDKIKQKNNATFKLVDGLDVEFDNTDTGLTATDIQTAIIEVNNKPVVTDYTQLTNTPDLTAMTHTNVTTLDKLSEYNGMLYYDNAAIGLSTEDTIPASQIQYENVTVEQALDQLLYVRPSVALSGGGTYEIGSTVNTVNLSWNINKTIISQSIDNSIGAITVGTTLYAISSANITSQKTYTITVDDGKQTATSSTSVVFRNRRCWGVSSSTDYTSALLTSLSSELLESRIKTFSVTSNTGQYVYYAYPSRLGTSRFFVGGFEGGFSLVSTLSYTNPSGYTEDYYVYRSENSSLGNINVIVN